MKVSSSVPLLRKRISMQGLRPRVCAPAFQLTPVKLASRAVGGDAAQGRPPPARIVDCHHHFIDPQIICIPGLDPAPSYTPEDYTSDSAGLQISSTVHVEAMPVTGVREVAMVEQMRASERCRVAAIVASCNLCDEDVGEQLLALKNASPAVVGVRWILDWDSGPFDGKNATHIACSR